MESKMSEQTARDVAVVTIPSIASRRVQLICQMMLHGIIGILTAVGACIIMSYLAHAVEGYLENHSILLVGIIVIFAGMIVIALCCVHDCTVEVLVRVRRIRRTYRTG